MFQAPSGPFSSWMTYCIAIEWGVEPLPSALRCTYRGFRGYAATDVGERQTPCTPLGGVLPWGACETLITIEGMGSVPNRDHD